MRLLATILLFVFSVSVWAQGNTNKYSINPKIGMSYDVNTKPWKSYGLGVNIFLLKNIYTGSFLRFNEIELFGPSEPRENRNDLSFMLGRYFGSRVFRFECQFGLSLVWGVNRGAKSYHTVSGYQYATENYSKLGLPLKLGFKLIPLDFMSIGLDFQANINSEFSFFSTFLSLEFGVLRNRIEPRPID